jgi:hypothetical protein
MTPEQIKDLIESTPYGIERARKAEELLNKHYEYLKGKTIYGGGVIGWMISLIIMSTPEGIEKSNKAEELLNKHILDLKGKTIRDRRGKDVDAIWMVIEKIIYNTPEGIEIASVLERILNKYKEDLKGKKIRIYDNEWKDVDAIEYMENMIIENRAQASSYTSYVDGQRQENSKQSFCNIS